ncbi:hypothetical protein J8273_1212 [Carpediemonas membranifera]|uniref:Uncharacterized protein n=1 Tax=Carpediemonas membranifera TaxID=201153 RepID=A0A8J6E6M7_9EUKA|nr:hypothetical protein J8273_1212 [Carpediemonas membranifera]|eukprot:KAG9397297.1 hypothetical protein J8273_1212 [Carpediemonas membranifera]
MDIKELISPLASFNDETRTSAAAKLAEYLREHPDTDFSVLEQEYNALYALSATKKKSSEARNILIGQMLLYGAVLRSSILTEKRLDSFVSSVLALASEKSYLELPCFSILVSLGTAVPAALEVLEAHLPHLAVPLETSVPDKANKLFILLELGRHGVIALPAITPALLTAMRPALADSTQTLPTVHGVWGSVLALITKDGMVDSECLVELVAFLREQSQQESHDRKLLALLVTQFLADTVLSPSTVDAIVDPALLATLAPSLTRKNHILGGRAKASIIAIGSAIATKPAVFEQCISRLRATEPAVRHALVTAIISGLDAATRAVMLDALIANIVAIVADDGDFFEVREAVDLIALLAKTRPEEADLPWVTKAVCLLTAGATLSPAADIADVPLSGIPGVPPDTTVPLFVTSALGRMTCHDRLCALLGQLYAMGMTTVFTLAAEIQGTFATSTPKGFRYAAARDLSLRGALEDVHAVDRTTIDPAMAVLLDHGVVLSAQNPDLARTLSDIAMVAKNPAETAVLGADAVLYTLSDHRSSPLVIKAAWAVLAQHFQEDAVNVVTGAIAPADNDDNDASSDSDSDSDDEDMLTESDLDIDMADIDALDLENAEVLESGDEDGEIDEGMADVDEADFASAAALQDQMGMVFRRQEDKAQLAARKAAFRTRVADLLEETIVKAPTAVTVASTPRFIEAAVTMVEEAHNTARAGAIMAKLGGRAKNAPADVAAAIIADVAQAVVTAPEPVKGKALELLGSLLVVCGETSEEATASLEVVLTHFISERTSGIPAAKLRKAVPQAMCPLAATVLGSNMPGPSQYVTAEACAVLSAMLPQYKTDVRAIQTVVAGVLRAAPSVTAAKRAKVVDKLAEALKGPVGAMGVDPGEVMQAACVSTGSKAVLELCEVVDACK